MRYKTVPGPVAMATLESVHAALPLVPEGVEDCCGRVVETTAVARREDAREWITFLRALELAAETPRGYRRVRTEVDPASLGEPFAENVFGAAELLDALDEAGSLTVEAAFERARHAVPRWERDRHPDWERVWVGRVERLLEWAVAFGLAVRDGETYRPSP